MEFVHVAESGLGLIKRLVNQLDFDDYWGERGSRGKGLKFTESGAARLAHTMGFLLCLSLVDDKKEAAQQFSDSLVKRLDYLAGYGGDATTTSVPPEVVPSWIVELSDDRTFGGFSLLWHQLNNEEANSEYVRSSANWIMRDGYHGKNHYKSRFCGGLLFNGADHSLGGAPNFSVNLNDSIGWSIHT